MRLTNPTGAGGEAAREYVRQLLDLLGDRDPLEVMEETVPWLRETVEEMDDRTLREPEEPGRWSVMDVVRHLADSELVYRYRMRMIVAQPGSDIPAYDQDAWAEGLDYRGDDPREALDELEVLRAADLRWLRGLSQEERARHGNHAERGRESVEEIVRLLAAHDLVHRRQVDRIRRAVERGGGEGDGRRPGGAR